MVLGIDPKVDYAFKRVFGDERNSDILIHLINAILRLPEPIVSVELLNPFSPKDYEDDKLTVLDIKARDDAGRLINIEMQMLLPYDFRSRILYYWAGLYRQQLHKGDEYSKIGPTISICLVNELMFPEVDDYVLSFELLDRHRGVCFSEDLQIHVIELVKFQRRLDELASPLEQWLYIFKNAEAMDPGQLPGQLADPAYRRTMEELEMLTKDELERERYESRLKAIRDHKSLMRGARAEGLAEGLERGELVGRINLCEEQLRRSLTPEDELNQLSIDELRQRAETLKAELFGSKS